ncbi:hypothetical protein LTR08_002414 [Meristemomyces frigidus]|nr:hypothetical protein LTR08_002414 [Meristemomyces frigidus]
MVVDHRDHMGNGIPNTASLVSSQHLESSSSSTASSTLSIGPAVTSTVASSSPPLQGAAGIETTTFTQTLSSTITLRHTTTLGSASVPDISLTSLTTSAVQTATATVAHGTTGSVHTSLETSGNPTIVPFPTSISNATSTLSLVSTETLGGAGPTATVQVTSIQATDIFQPIATDAPPSQIPQRGDHPIPRLGVQQQTEKLQTNKFYANFFLGDQAAGTWTHPYSIAWARGGGETDSWGLSISHVERSQLATGIANSSIAAGEWSFFANPTGIQSLVLSAAELGNGTTLTTDSLEAFSVNVNLVDSASSQPRITFPLVQGMAFVTGRYNSGTPLVQSGIGITSLTYAGAVINGTTYKYRTVLQNGLTWLIYVTPASAGYSENSFTLLSSGTIQGPSGFGGYIQIAKVPTGSSDAESIYDASAGVYPVAANISGSVDGTAGSYTLSWSKQGVTSRSLLMFGLPHHIASLSYTTTAGVMELQLVTTTKGTATAIRGDSWTLNEPSLPISMSFAPWTQQGGSIATVSAEAVAAINAAGYAELMQNISQQTNVGSLYYDGKALAKFAAICYTVNDLGNNASLAQTGLIVLKSAFALHVDNEMSFPLAYDTAWGGVVSSSTYQTGNIGDDYGNTVYNDHHFHYGYFVYAAAVIGYLDPTWLNANKAWVNTLVRDYGNSITDDPYFPFQRNFDWYHGHSWAHGLIETADGKDQESSSEDTMASYAMKMWGQIIGDINMEARGNLMLAVQKRSLQNYYLYTTDNTVEPAEFIGNKAAGIMFENKIDHVTYFGNAPEYTEGIHMLPLMPFSTLSRSSTFVLQEWDAYFSSSGIKPVDQVSGGWKGILMANLAIVDPVTSYNYFSNSSGNFSLGDLDGGASQTWYLAWSAALGGHPGSYKEKRQDVLFADELDELREELSGKKEENGYIERRATRSGSMRSSRLRQRTRGTDTEGRLTHVSDVW